MTEVQLDSGKYIGHNQMDDFTTRRSVGSTVGVNLSRGVQLPRGETSCAKDTTQLHQHETENRNRAARTDRYCLHCKFFVSKPDRALAESNNDVVLWQGRDVQGSLGGFSYNFGARSYALS